MIQKEQFLTMLNTRRTFLVSTSAAGAGLLIGCRREEGTEHDPSKKNAPLAVSLRKDGGPEAQEPEVTATEDLMREHGVIRRALVVYREAAGRLRTKPSDVPSDALRKAAQLLRTFGEDYHEELLEEAHIFPALKRVGGAAAGLVDVLTVQHDRGREITDYVIAVTETAVTPAHVVPLARELEAFARMYEEHAAIEDTIVFPAWKKTMSAQRLEEMGELFEQIEQKTFGKDGFDDAVQQIAAIEQAFGFDLRQFTPAPPGKP